MESLEALELAILEYKKDLEEDSNNQWVKNVLQGLKEAKQDLERLKKMNEVWHKHEVTESVDINENHLEELYSFITHLVEENIELRKKIENIKKLPNCDICDEEWFSCMCLRKKIKEVLGNE